VNNWEWMRLQLMIILLLSISLKCLSQSFDERDFRRYTAVNGLSQNYVSGIEQDAYGYIWISTYKGLNRFDGNRFQQFHSDSGRNSLLHDAIFRLKWLDKERLAATTFSGLHIINTRTLEERNLIIPQPSPKYLNWLNKVSDAVSDKNGNIFVSTLTGFYHFNNKDELVFRYDHPLIKHKWTAFGWNIIKIDDNLLLLSTFEGPYIYHIAQKEIHAIGDNDDPFYRQLATPANLITAIRSRNNSLHVIMPGNNNDLILFNMQRKTAQSIKAPFAVPEKFAGDLGAAVQQINDSVFAINTKEHGFYLIDYNLQTNSYNIPPQFYFGNFVCTALLVDKNNRLWIGTDEGLFYEKKPAGKIEQLTVKQSLQRNEISSIDISKDKLFVGTTREGLWVFNDENLKPLKRIDFSVYRINEYPNNIWCTLPIQNDTLFTGTIGVWVNTKNLTHGIIKLSHLDSTYEGVDMLFKDSHNNVYLKKAMNNVFFCRGSDGKMRKLNYQKELSNIGRVSSMTEDAEGNIWFVGYGMKRFNYGSQKFDVILDSFPSIKVPEKTISSNVVFDKTGKMYFGILENGLMIYDPVKKKFSRLTRSEGLPDNSIHSLFLHNKKLWIGTESGLACYDLASKKIFSFGIADGIPTDPYVNYFFCYDSTHRKLYGAFRNIIYRFNPDSLNKNNSPPEFSIESLVVSGKETIYHPADQIGFSYKGNNIVINLASVYFEDNYQQQFAYRLIQSGDEQWQDIGSQRSIIFSNLSSNKHRLQVKVYTRDGSWTEQVKEIMIIIRPPFWKTWWFDLIIALSIAAALYALYKRRVNQIKEKANLDKQLTEFEMKALHAQMNPHFVFNCLNSIKEMILQDEKQNASRYLSKFAQLIRITLEESRQPFITVKQCIDHLQQYLDMEKIRFAEFNYNIEVEQDLPVNEIHIAPMLVQPLIENAIWHGLQKQAGEKNLNIRFYRSGMQLVCEIEDNGIGIRKSRENKPGLHPAHRSMGIDNIHERLTLLNEKYKMNCSLTITDRSDLSGKKSGTLAILAVNM
jgi:ligand-binding sensor domain-containing protein